jgi:hypothetical protein
MTGSGSSADSHDLAGFGYRQELHRTLGGFSSFAAAFSYMWGGLLFVVGAIAVGGIYFLTTARRQMGVLAEHQAVLDPDVPPAPPIGAP